MESVLLRVKALMSNDCHEICPCLTVPKEEGTCNFQRRRKEARVRGAIVKLVWVALHGIVILGLLFAETDLTWAWTKSRFVYLTAYIFLAVTNAAFYVALCVANPGYLQTGVHALSLSQRKRGSQHPTEILDAMEQGIGGLAHVDLTLGRRGSQKDKLKLNLDRTVTLPSLPSQRSRPEFENEGWQGGRHGGGAREGTSTEVSDIFLPASEMIPRCNVKVTTVRTRGSSLGGADELYSAFKMSLDRAERNNEDANEPLLHADKAGETSTSWSDRSEDAHLAMERRPSKPVSPSGFSKPERQFFWYEGPSPGRWCEICGAWQTLRSRHCHDCGRCVRRFDHHCTWIGSCIGQDNHLLLWWYLLIQFTLLAWNLQINLGAFGLPVGLGFGRTTVLLYCLVINSVMTFFVAMLLIYHSYLVISAQTTFELILGQSVTASGAAKVPYLQNLPVDARPFNQGIIKNVLDFCCVKGAKTYQMPAALSARKSVS